MRRLRLILGVAISIGLLFFVFRGIHLQRTLAAARTANYEFFAFSIGFLMLSLVIKAVRWQFLLAPVRRVRFLSLFSAVLIAFFSNNILPSNAGDLVRNVVLGKREGIPQSAVFATIVVEKILDIGTLACFALAFSQIYPVPGWVRLVGFVGTAVFTAAIFILLLLAFRAELVTRLLGRLTARFQSRVVTRAVEQLNTFIYGTRQSFRLSAVLPAIGLSVVLWAVLAVAYLWIGRALSIEAADQAYFLVVSVIGLGSAIPAVLGNVGTLEFFSIDTLQIFGVAQSQGLAFAILLRAARMVPVLLGALVFWRLGFTLFGRGGTTAPAGGPSGDAPPAPDANVVASTRTGPTPLAALRARLVALPAAERASRQAEAVLGRLGLGRPEVLSDMFSNRTDLATSIALTLIVGFAAIIRFYRLGANSLWVDEIATAYYIQPDQSWWWTATNPLYAPIPCPPLIFLMSRVTTLLGPSEFFIRLPAALMGIIGVALTYWVVGHMFGRVAGLIGSFLLAVSRFHLHYSQDARYYPPLLVFSVAALYCFWRALDLNTTEPIWRTGAASPPRSIRDLLRFDAEHRRWWIGFIVFTLLGTYTHLFALFVPAIATMFIAWLAVRELAWIRENRASPWPFVRQVIGPFAASGLSILILYIPMFPFVVTGLLGPRGVGSSQRPPFTWQVVIQFYFTAFNGFVGGNQAASFIFFTLFLLGLAAMIARHRRGVVLLLLYVFVPVTVVAVSRPQHFFSAKYVIFLLPIYLGLIAYGIANIGAVVRSPRFAIALATVLSLSLGAFSVATYNTYYDTEKQDWRSAVVFLNQVAQPGDVVVVAGSKVAFGADKALEYAFTYYGLNVPDITYASESPFQDAYPLRQKYAKAPRVWVLLTPSKTNHQLRTKWLEDYQTFHYTKITVFFHDNALVNEQARKQEIDKYYHVALTTKMNWRTASNLALEYMRDGSDPQGVEKAVAQYQQALQSNPDKVSFYLSLGKLAMKQKQYDLAETYLRQAVKFEGNPDVLHGFLLRLLTLSKKPASPPFSPARPYMALGKLDALRGNNAEAITLFQQAVTIAPDKGRPHISLGQLDLKLNKVDDAITELNRAIQAEPKRSRPHLLLAKYYKKNGRPDDAIYQYQAVAALKGGHPHVHISLGKLYQVKGKFDTAQVEYAAAASLRPGKARPPTLMASLYIRQNRLTEAQYQLTRATQLEPTRWKPHVLLGQVYEKQHQPGLAQAELLTAIKVAPTKPKPTISLGKFYQQENRFADARDTLAKTPNPNLRSKLLLGESMARLNDLAGAMTVFQTASKSEPTKAKPHLDIAHLLVWQNQLAAAEAEVQLAIKVEPTDARAYLAAGRTELTAKKYDTARAYLEQAIKLSGTRAGPHLALGHGLIEQKKGGDSLTELQSAASLAPTKARPHLLLARAEMALQNLSEASAQYDQALRLEPGQARPHIGKGVILGKQSQYQAATLEFQQALSHDPSKARAYVGLGKMSGKSDKWTDAIGWFQEALNPPPSAIAPQHRAKPARPKVKPYFMIAIANTKLSDFDAAMKSASRGLSIKNDASRGHVVLGNIYALQEQKATSEGNPDQRGVAERIKNLLGLATAEYQQAAKLQPTKARPVVMQGLLSQQNGDQSAAETTFKRAISVEDKARTHALLGKLYQRQKKIAPASAEFQRTIDLSSKKPRGYVLLGHLKASQKDYKGALAEADAAIKNAVPKARSHLAAGAAQIQLKRPDLAATEFAQAQTLAPTKARPHVALGIANVKQNNLADATAQFRVALGLTGNRVRPSTQLGKLSAKQSQWKEAVDWYQSALNAPASGAPPRLGAVPSAQGKAKPYFLISVADARQNHLSDALDMATIGVTVDPQAARGHVQVGNVYALQKNAGSATKEYQAAAKLAPTKARPVTMLGLLLAQHGDSAAARATYAQAIKIQDKGRVHALIGKLDQKASQFDAAANQYQRTIQLSPTKNQGYLLLSHLRARQKDWKGALAQAQAAVQNATPKARSYLAVGAAQLQLKHPDLALGAYQQAIAVAPTKGRPYLAKGVALLKQNQYDDATRSFGAGITQDPSLARGYTLLGKMSAKQSRWTDAIKLYQQALSTSAAGAPPRLGSTRAVLPRVKPHFLTAVADGHLHKPADAVAAVNAGLAINHSLARGHDILGRLYAGQNNGSAAMAEYQTAQKIQPTKGRPVALQGLLKSKNGDLAGAEALLRQAIGIEDKGRSHALLGKVYYADKKADAATTEYHRAIQLDPTKDRAYLLLARVSAAKKDWAGAQAIVTEALQKGPPKAQPHVAMGHLKMEQKQLDGAIGEFEQAIQLGPGRARPHNALGHVYAKQKQNDDAIAQYAMSLNVRSDKPRAHFATGRLYSKQGKPRIDDAIAQFQQAAKLKLNTGRFHVLLGKQYWRTGLRDQATAEFATALKMIPTKVRPYLMTGHLLATERQYGPSAQMFGKAFQLQPNKARPHNLMGLLYVAQQQTDLARKEYQAAAKIAPTKARALMLLGHLDASLKDPPQHDGVFAAIADYQQAIARNPNKANAYASIGRIYQRMTKLDEAYTPLTKAIQIKPGLAMAHYRLALVLEGYQRWSDAEREWETYLELQPRGGHSLDARIHLAKLLGMPYQLTPHQTKVQSRGKH